ncbi:helix-turn-helix domain-containing protein [Metarhizobium album]|uniref:helix-turn-helix domain-containing protein n=1 Tax=Metarhizobium album TaxID=2182425 RepID=UPI000FFEE5F6|nr:helix-turn-helix transcriptional regulator [Rhizobium album]
MNEGILRRIEKRMSELDLTQSEVSRIAAIDRSFLKNLRSSIKSGSPYGISVLTLQKLAPALKTTASWLAEGAPHHTVNLTAPAMPQNITVNKVPGAVIIAAGWTPVSSWAAVKEGAEIFPIMCQVAHENQILFEVQCDDIRRVASRGDFLVGDISETAKTSLSNGSIAVIDRTSTAGEKVARVVCQVRRRRDNFELWSLSDKQLPLGGFAAEALHKGLDQYSIYAKVIGVVSRLGDL